MQRRHPRHPVREGHDSLRNRSARALIVVQLLLVAPSNEHRGQRVAEGDRVLDTGVHALPAGWAVDVCRVSGEQDPPGAVAICQSVVDPEPRAPDDLADAGRSVHWTPRVQEMLHVGDVGVLRRVIHGSHDPVAPVRQRRYHDEPFGRKEQHYLVRGRPVQPNISEHERLLVRVTGETDAGPLAHRAVHPVGADDVSGADRPRTLAIGGDRNRDTVGVLPQVVDRVWALHVAAQLAQPAEEDRFGDLLRNHQRIRVARGQPVEAYCGQPTVAVSDHEPRHNMAFGS
jgi:hypothetical protein